MEKQISCGVFVRETGCSHRMLPRGCNETPCHLQNGLRWWSRFIFFSYEGSRGPPMVLFSQGEGDPNQRGNKLSSGPLSRKISSINLCCALHFNLFAPSQNFSGVSFFLSSSVSLAPISKAHFSRPTKSWKILRPPTSHLQCEVEQCKAEDNKVAAGLTFASVSSSVFHHLQDAQKWLHNRRA